MKMAPYVVIYPNIVGISLGHKYGLEWTVVANGLSLLAKNDACLLNVLNVLKVLNVLNLLKMPIGPIAQGPIAQGPVDTRNNQLIRTALCK